MQCGYAESYKGIYIMLLDVTLPIRGEAEVDKISCAIIIPALVLFIFHEVLNSQGFTR